jgi:hypothetical protein
MSLTVTTTFSRATTDCPTGKRMHKTVPGGSSASPLTTMNSKQISTSFVDRNCFQLRGMAWMVDDRNEAAHTTIGEEDAASARTRS